MYINEINNNIFIVNFKIMLGVGFKLNVRIALTHLL